MSTESDTSILDIEELKARCLGNMNLVERVLSKMSEQLDRDLAQLETALAAGDAEQTAQFAHRIKGAAASVSARSLFDAASAVEVKALEQSLTELPSHVDRLREDRSRLSICLKTTQLKN